MPLCTKSVVIAVGMTILTSILAYAIAYESLIIKKFDVNIFLIIGGIWMMAIFYIFERAIPYLNRLKLKKVSVDAIIERQ